MPAAGNGLTINMPQTPEGLAITLATSGTFSGGTTIDVPAGDNIALAGGTFSGGVVYNMGQGATIDLTGGQTLTYDGTLTGSGAGTVQLSGGIMQIGLGGLTLNFPGNIFQWTGGAIDTSVGDLTNLGTINLAGSNDKGLYDDGTLDNYGSIIQTGSGNLGLHSDGQSPTTLKIERSASYLIESDSGVDNPFGNQTAIVNEGTIEKTAGAGISTILVNGALSNTGIIEADSGTLALLANSFSQISGTTLTGGTWNALDGANLDFPNETVFTSSAANISLGGAGAEINPLIDWSSNSGSFSITGGATLTLDNDFANSGSLTIGAGSSFTVNGNETQTASGALNAQLGGTPSSGLYGQLVVDGAATLGGTLNVVLVNGYSPSPGQDYQVMSFTSATGSFATFSGLPPGMTETQTAAALDLDVASTEADLLPTNVTAPTSAPAGDAITVNWQVENQTDFAAAGSWQDSVYVSPTDAITSSSILLGTAEHTGGLAGNGTYNASLTAALPALAPGYYYVLVEVDSLYQVADEDRANNTLAAATGQLDASVPALTLGKNFNDSFTAADQDRYYQVTVPAGGSLSVALTSTASSGAMALYVSQGTLPTPYNYQEAAAAANQPSQTVTVPQVLAAGTYYVLAHSVSGDAATTGYTIMASQTSALAVSALSPDSGGAYGTVTIEIDGTNFSPAITASLTQGTTTLNAMAIDFASASQVFATFRLANAPVGSYSVTVRQGGESATGSTAFQVVVATLETSVVGPGQVVSVPMPLSVQLSTPQFVRSGRTAAIVISYTNPNNFDMVAPLFTVSTTNVDAYLSTPDDPNDYTQSAQVLAVAPSGPAGILRAGQSGQLTLTLLSDDTIDGDTVPVEVDQIATGQNIDWASQQASLQLSTIATAAWNVIFGNLITSLGSTTDSYNAALAQAATYLGSLGETTADVSDVGRLWTFLVAQADASFPSSSLTSAVDATISSPGSLPLAIDRTFASSISGRDTEGIFGLGWVTSWQTSLSVAADGNVTVELRRRPHQFHPSTQRQLPGH